MAVIIDGKKISQQIKDEVRAEVAALADKPSLAVIIVGSDPASLIYVGHKKKACEYAGINSMVYSLPEDTREEELIELIAKLNGSGDVNGILVQHPMPEHINEDNVFRSIAPQKDVDCFNPYNVGMLSMGDPTLVSCTPAGIIELLKRYDIAIEGKNCVVIGRSNIVGKPVASLLIKENGTVTICHSKTKDLAAVTRQADILVAAVGKKKFVTADMVKDGAVIIDVGVHHLEGKKRCGDVDYDGCFEKASYITPVPGGVGPMTIAMLMKNCLEAYKMQKN